MNCANVLPLLCLLTMTGRAQASSIPLPIGVNDATPDAYVAEVYGDQYTDGRDYISDGSVVGLNAADPDIPTGTTAELNMCASSLCGGGNEFFGGFADVPTGTLGAFADSGPSDQAQANAYINANLAFTGTGTVTIKMLVLGTLSDIASTDTYEGAEYSAGMSAYAYSIDPNTGVANQLGSTLEAGAGICEGAFHTPYNLCNVADSVDQTVSIVLNVDPTHDLFAFSAQAIASAFGDASADGAHTSALSIELSPGVTLDQSNGFLTESGEPNFGTAATPEPSLAGLSALALVGLVVARRKRKTS
jgi:hypothetical protein